MKRLSFLIALAVLLVILAGSSASAGPDIRISLIAGNLPDNESTPHKTEGTNSLGSAATTNTMHAVADR